MGEEKTFHSKIAHDHNLTMNESRTFSTKPPFLPQAHPFHLIICCFSYLSSEQRLNYLVKIDAQGRLRWVRNSQLVDTSPNKWKDSDGGMGIVPLDGTEDHSVEHRMRRQVSTLSGSPSSDSGSGSEDFEGEAEHYAGNPGDGMVKKAIKSHLTAKGLSERLLRRTVKKNTWIYVAVCTVRLLSDLGLWILMQSLLNLSPGHEV